jgi:hypothetical protein
LDQLTATTTMPALAACSRVPALIEGPSSRPRAMKTLANLESFVRVRRPAASQPRRLSLALASRNVAMRLCSNQVCNFRRAFSVKSVYQVLQDSIGLRDAFVLT